MTNTVFDNFDAVIGTLREVENEVQQLQKYMPSCTLPTHEKEMLEAATRAATLDMVLETLRLLKEKYKKKYEQANQAET